jgi:hypothetical protein
MAQRRASSAQARPAPRPAAAAAPITTTGSSNRDALASLLEGEDDVSIVKIAADALESITKSEVGMQLDAAHRWPRSIARFREDAATLATMTKETAQSCIYTLPVRKGGDKPITGPSVRLAEMCATSWGNLHTGARVIDIGHRDVTAQALAWDLEKNLRLSIEVKRGIVTGDGRRYGDDMIRVTSMAAISIALRNAIFRIIPRALVNEVYGKAERVATGVEDGTFEAERQAIVAVFVERWHVPLERVCARLGVAKFQDIDQEALATLIGIGQAIKARESSIEECFPVKGAKAGPPVSKGSALDAIAADLKSKKGKSEPPPANDDGQLTVAEVLDALVDADESWSRVMTERATAAISAWTPEQQRRAHAWATAFVETAEDQNPPEQPEFCFAPREPGEEG